MSGLEVIPIATGIVCAAAAVKQIVSRAQRQEKSKASFYSDDEDYEGESRRSRRSRSRNRFCDRPHNRSRNTSRSRSNSRSSRRSVSLSRDSPRGWTFMYKSRSRSRRIDRRVSRSLAQPKRSRSRNSARQESRRRHGMGSSPERSTLNSSHHQPLRLNDQEMRRITTQWRHNPMKHLQPCEGKVVRVVAQYPSRHAYATAGYTCTSCHHKVAGSEIATWHNFLPNDQGEVWLHRDFILRYHAKSDKGFQYNICGAWVTGIEQLVLHFTGHRYGELRRVIPVAEWRGSLG